MSKECYDIKTVLKLPNNEEEARRFYIYDGIKVQQLYEKISRAHCSTLRITVETHKIFYLDYENQKIRLENDEELKCALYNSRYRQKNDLTIIVEPISTNIEQETSKKVESSQESIITPKIQEKKDQKPKREVEKQVSKETSENSSLPKAINMIEQSKTELKVTPEISSSLQTGKTSTQNSQVEFNSLIKNLNENGKSLTKPERNNELLNLEHLRNEMNIPKTQVAQNLDKLDIKPRQIAHLLSDLSRKKEICEVYQKLEQNIQTLVTTKVNEHPLGQELLSRYINSNHSYKEIILIAEELNMKFCIDENISKLIEELIKLESRNKNSSIHEYFEKISKNFPFSKEMEEKLVKLYPLNDLKRKHCDDSFSRKKLKDK